MTQGDPSSAQDGHAREASGISEWLTRRFTTLPPGRLAVDAIMCYALTALLGMVSGLVEVAAQKQGVQPAPESVSFNVIEFVGILIRSASSVTYYAGHVFLAIAAAKFVALAVASTFAARATDNKVEARS